MSEEVTRYDKEIIHDNMYDAYLELKGIVDDLDKEPKAERFFRVVLEMTDLYVRKNHDYGDSFGEVYKDYGINSGIIMLRHKLARIESIARKGNKIDESIKDSLIDLASYAIMTLIELE